MRIRRLLSTFPLMLALGACTTATRSGGTSADAAAPAPAAGCDAAAVQAALGREATPEVVEQARRDAGADSVRTLRPDQPVTLEYLEGRLNLLVDDGNTVTGARCG